MKISLCILLPLVYLPCVTSLANDIASHSYLRRRLTKSSSDSSSGLEPESPSVSLEQDAIQDIALEETSSDAASAEAPIAASDVGEVASLDGGSKISAVSPDEEETEEETIEDNPNSVSQEDVQEEIEDEQPDETSQSEEEGNEESEEEETPDHGKVDVLFVLYAE